MGRRTMFTRSMFLCITILFSLGSPSMTCRAQNSSASAGERLRGHVTDPSGLAVTGAAATARNVLSGNSKTSETLADGSFEFDLEPGSYALTVTAPGLVLNPRRVELAAGHPLDLGTLQLSLIGSLENVVVSGSRVAELQEEAPTKVLEVTSEQIRNTGYERVGDVLSELPGVVTQAQSFGVSIVGGEQIDGMNSKETLVLLDGLPYVGARGIKEGYIDLNQQDVGRLERVEVVKGAASALYGTDALGGVINLVSREPSNPLDIDATASGGSLGQIDTRLGIGGRWGKLSGFLDLEHHQRGS
jgi:outer membrane receptor for ferrienterochelin and colicins